MPETYLTTLEQELLTALVDMMALRDAESVTPTERATVINAALRAIAKARGEARPA